MTLRTEKLIEKLVKSRKVRVITPYPITHRFGVANDFVGKSLLSMMTARFPFRAEQDWETRIIDGKVGVNDTIANPNYTLNVDDKVFHHNPTVIEPSVPDEIRIIEETDDYVAVFKPAPLPMHPGGRYNKNTLTWMLEDLGYMDLKIVHRLDAVTSGIVLFGKTRDFAQKAMLCFAENNVHKTYYALVSGVPTETERIIDLPIKRKTGFVFESRLGLEAAKESQTKFTVIKRGTSSALVKCEPITGRTHQIRLHLESWGHPIIDDPIYGIGGDKSSIKAQNIGISLISSGLEIEELGISLSTEIPEDWKNLSYLH